MTLSKFDDIKDILLNNDIEILSIIESDLICGICQKLAKEPYSTICGCTHCGSCIQKYVCVGEKYCPGSKLECKDCLLDQNTNIYFDPKTNIRISKLNAKCPNKLCEFETTLSEMKQHIKNCENKKSYCPYFSVGCNDNKITLMTADKHIQDNSVNHAYMLVEHVNNARNDIDSLIRNYEERLECQQKELLELKCDININRNLVISEQSEFTDGKEIGIFNVFYKLDKSIRFPNMFLVVIVLILAIYILYVQQYHEEKIALLRHQIANIDNYDYGEYIWKISNFSQKLKDAKDEKRTMIESGVFFSHKYGYKLKLQMYPNGMNYHKNIHLSLQVVMLAGPYDDLLPWPFKKGVKIGFVDQLTGENIASVFVHSSGYTYSSLRRVTSEGSEKGNDVRFDLGVLVAKEGFMKKDTVYVHCLVK